jgi:APA family basic amino acid/polyamine antiporter
MYIIGMIPILFGLSITTITNMVQLIGACYAFLNFKAYISLPKLYPDAWAKSKYHVPNGLYYFLCCVSLAGFCVTLWKSCLSMSPILVGINITAIVVLAILGFVRGKKGNVEIHTSIWCGDPEGDAKAAEIMAASMNKK